MKIVLDFDDTIFNTSGLYQCFFKVFESVGFLQEEFLSGYEEAKGKRGDFDLPTLVDLLYESKSFDKNAVERELSLALDKARAFVYPDFFDFAKKFNRESFIILSFGTTPFQKLKIKKSNIMPFFGEVIITPKEKDEEIENICGKYSREKIFFVEDKAAQIDMVKNKFPEVVVMKMERPEGRYIKAKSALADYVIKNFSEAEKIIDEEIKDIKIK